MFLKITNNNNNEYNYCGEPIDVVYTWVNGSDRNFKTSMKHYLTKQNYQSNDFLEARFDDKYELKFSLR